MTDIQIITTRKKVKTVTGKHRGEKRMSSQTDLQRVIRKILDLKPKYLKRDTKKIKDKVNNNNKRKYKGPRMRPEFNKK